MNLHVSTCLDIFHDFIGHVVKMAMYFRHIVLNIDIFFSTGIVNKMFWVPNKIPVNRTECRCNCFDTVYKGRLISVYRKFEHFIVGLGGGGRVGPRF